MNEPLFIVVDLFCGAGGTTKGMEDAQLPKRLLLDYDGLINGGLSDLHVGANFKDEGFFKIAKVIACVNHDPKAIKSHWLNNPDVHHFEEDIRTLDLTALVEIVDHYRRKYPNALLILWASLECTNFSKAKGGQPRDADSRTLADHLDRYVVALNPDYIQIENVVEFMSWGPLDEKGKPVSRKNGQDWLRWRNMICAHGYRDEWRELNSANYGAYTSRNRLFGIFARPWLPIAFPEPTHAKNPSKQSMHGDLKKWMPVKEVLDFSDEGESIFHELYPRTRKKSYQYLTRKQKKKKVAEKCIVVFPSCVETPLYGMEPKLVLWRKDAALFDPLISDYCLQHSIGEDAISFYLYDPLAENSKARVLAGLIKYVSKGDTAFISKYFSGRPKGKVNSINSPSPTVTTFGGSSLVQTKNYSDLPVDEPAGTLTTIDHHALVQAQFLALNYSQGGQHSSIEDPSPTLTTKDRISIVSPEFLSIHNGKSKTRSVDEPSPTISTKDRLVLVQLQHLGSQTQSIDQPAGTLMPNDKHRLVHCDPFIIPTNYDNGPKSIDEPLQVITANRKHHYLCNPSHGGHSTSTEAPCPVLVARQDKAPLSLVQVIEGKAYIPVFEDDSECTKEIKRFMATYGLVDIKMRMLRIGEMLFIQGLQKKEGKKFELYGTQADQKKFIGNSVVPEVVDAWIRSIAMRIIPIMHKVIDFRKQQDAA